jgi:hypothetical protein
MTSPEIGKPPLSARQSTLAIRCLSLAGSWTILFSLAVSRNDGLFLFGTMFSMMVNASQFCGFQTGA